MYTFLKSNKIMMPPVGKFIPDDIKDELSRRVKEEPPDDMTMTDLMKSEKKNNYVIELPSYPAMNEDEGVVIKVEDTDESMEYEDKPEVDALEDVSGNLEKNYSESAEETTNSLLCKFCGKQFFRAYYFNLHIKTHQHPITGNHLSSDKPHKCQECGKTFAQLQHLTGHSRIHIAGRYYECPICRRKFTELSNLTMHLLKTHPDEKPFKCSECDKQFTQSSALKKHLRAHNSNTSQEDLDRIDMMFFVNDRADKESEEPFRKRIKLEKEDIQILPEKATPTKEKLILPQEEKAPPLKQASVPLKVKSPPKPKSPGKEKACKLKEEKQLGVLLNDKSFERTLTSKEITIVQKSSAKNSSVSSCNLVASPRIKEVAPTVIHLSDNREECPTSPSLELTVDDDADSVCEVEATTPAPLKDKPILLKCQQLTPSIRGDGNRETVNVRLSKDLFPLKNGVPLEQVQNPLIKITKFPKGSLESESPSTKGQSSPLKSTSGSDENAVESQDSTEETENSNHSSVCNGDRSLKGKTLPFVSLSRNKSELFTSWTKKKPESRAPVPTLVKPDGDFDVRFKCHRCDIFLETEEKLNAHLMDHTGVKLYECRFCGKDFTTMTSLKRHLYYHVVGCIPQDCTRCDKIFSTFTDLKDHCVSNKCDAPHNKTKFKCFRCRRHMPSLRRLKMHLLSQCSEEPVKYYFPKKTDASMKEKDVAESNIVKENGSMEDTSGAAKLSKNDWVTQKFEKTSVISQSDIQDLNLDGEDVEALRVLSEAGCAEKGREYWNLQCQGCGHKFENVEKAKVHSELGCGLNSKGNPTVEKVPLKIKVAFEENADLQCSLICSECEKEFIGVEKMLLHIKEHIYEENCMTCPVLKCERLFKDPDDFKIHLKAHTGHMPFKCSDCGKRFFLRENYENHARRHGIMKNWSSIYEGFGEKQEKCSGSARSPITIESSIINLEVGEADVDKKSKSSSEPSKIPAQTDYRKKKEDSVLQTLNVKRDAKSKAPSAVNKTSAVNRTPVANKSSPSVNRPSPLANKQSPLTSRPVPPDTNRSPPLIDKPSPVFNRPAPIHSRPPAVLSRSTLSMTGTSTFSKPSPVLNNRVAHSSGGSFSVTPQGIFAVGPARPYPGPITGGSKTAFHPIASKDPQIQYHAPTYFRLSEQSSRASIQASNAALRKYPRSGRCDVCKKICSRLDKHMMVHLNQKPHLCPVCPQAFRQSEHLRRHIRARHEGNHRQFECPQCHKRLTRKDKLKEHMKNCCRLMAEATIHTLGDSLFEMIPGPLENSLDGHASP